MRRLILFSIILLLFFSFSAKIIIAENTEQLLNIDFVNMEVKDIIKALSIHTGVNIVPDKNVEGNISVYLKKVTLQQALELILVPNGFTYSEKNNIYYVKKITENPYVKISENNLTLFADNVDLSQVIREISTQSNLNIIFTKPVDIKITSHIHNIPLEAALLRILNENGLTFEKQNGIYRVRQYKPPYSVVYEEGNLSISARNADIKDLIRQIAMETEKNMVVDQDVQNKVTININNTDFEAALNALLGAYALSMAKYKDIYRIYKREQGFKLPLTLVNNKLSVDVRQAQLADILSQIAAIGGLNLVMYADMKDKITARFQNIPLEQGLKLLFNGTNYDFKLENNLLLAGDISANRKESELFTKEKIYYLDYVRASKFVSLLPASIPVNNLKVIIDQNAVMVTGTEEMQKKVQDLILSLDKKIPQIIIDVLVVEVNRSKSKKLGLADITGANGRWTGTLSPSSQDANLILHYTTTGNFANDIALNLQALESKGIVEIKANPKITTSSGHSAKINVGREELFRVVTSSGNPEVPLVQIEKIPSGISLDIVPWASPQSDEITVNIKAEVSSSSSQRSTGDLPTISTRKAETELTIKEEQTIVIGGLIQSRETDASDRTPILSKIPIIKYIFSKKLKETAKTELIFYITPHFLKENEK